MGYRPDHLPALAGAHLDAIGTRLALDLGAPCLRIVDVIDRSNYVSPCKQLPVVVPPAHPFDEPFNAPLDLDRILHGIDPTLGTQFGAGGGTMSLCSASR